MAATPLSGMKRRLIRCVLGALGAVLLLVTFYLLASWIGSSISANGPPEPLSDNAQTVQIMIETNGLHTSIVVPIVSDSKDWREEFPSASMPRPNGTLATHLAIGWGEKDVFLNVPTMEDLELGTALRIITIGGDSLLRVSHYRRPAPSENHRPLRISVEQYEQIVRSIERAIPEIPSGETREIMHGAYGDDAYYEAFGRYTMINTCNTWVGDVLAEAGIEMGMWTPLAGGVMKWIPMPQEAP